MQPLIEAIAENIWILIPLTAVGIGVLSVVGSMVAAMLKQRQFERSRREISAYIAEGSMSPEEGERLLRIQLKD